MSASMTICRKAGHPAIHNLAAVCFLLERDARGNMIKVHLSLAELSFRQARWKINPNRDITLLYDLETTDVIRIGIDGWLNDAEEYSTQPTARAVPVWTNVGKKNDTSYVLAVQDILNDRFSALAE